VFRVPFGLETPPHGRAALRATQHSTFESYSASKRLHMLIPAPDLLLADEAHVGPDPVAWRLVGHMIGRSLIGATAPPTRGLGHSKAEIPVKA